MGRIFPTIDFKWNEPRPIRRALDKIVAAETGWRTKLKRRLVLVVPLIILLVVKVAFGVSETGTVSMDLSSAGLLILGTALFLSYFIDLVYWIAPREIYLTENGLVRQHGQAADSWRWDEIKRIELTRTEFDGTRIRVMVISLVPGTPKLSPEIVGVADKVDETELLQVLRNRGIDAEVVE